MRYLLFAICLLTPATFGQAAKPDASPNALIRKALGHFNANKKQAYAYTYIEMWHNQNFNKHGKLVANQNATFESIFIDDLPYLRMIEENGEPLSGKAARREKEKYEAAAEARRGMTLEQKQAELRVTNFTFPFELNLLAELYTSRIVDTEMLNGRPAIHVDCIPRTDLKAKNEAESEALNVHVQVWIDVKDEIFSRFDGELLAPVNNMMVGSKASVSFAPLDGVWLPSYTTVQGRTKLGRSIVGFKTDLTYSSFQKFRVDVRVLDDNGSEIPLAN